jgi:hypothetical protein
MPDQSHRTITTGPLAFYKRWRFRRAARDYYDRLGPCLVQRHGEKSAYTSEQIEQAVAEAGLNQRYIVLGYAAFLDAEAFASVTSRVPEFLPFYEARTLLVLHGKYKNSIPRKART